MCTRPQELLFTSPSGGPQCHFLTHLNQAIDRAAESPEKAASCAPVTACRAGADGEKEAEEEGLSATVKARTTSFFSDLMRTLKEPVFVCTMLGYAVYTGLLPQVHLLF